MFCSAKCFNGSCGGSKPQTEQNEKMLSFVRFDRPYEACQYGAFFVSKFNLSLAFTNDLCFSTLIFILFNLDIGFSNQHSLYSTVTFVSEVQLSLYTTLTFVFEVQPSLLIFNLDILFLKFSIRFIQFVTNRSISRTWLNLIETGEQIRGRFIGNDIELRKHFRTEHSSAARSCNGANQVLQILSRETFRYMYRMWFSNVWLYFQLFALWRLIAKYLWRHEKSLNCAHLISKKGGSPRLILGNLVSRVFSYVIGKQTFFRVSFKCRVSDRVKMSIETRKFRSVSCRRAQHGLALHIQQNVQNRVCILTETIV